MGVWGGWESDVVVSREDLCSAEVLVFWVTLQFVPRTLLIALSHQKHRTTFDVRK
jgi:hypothetical protein